VPIPLVVTALPAPGGASRLSVLGFVAHRLRRTPITLVGPVLITAVWATLRMLPPLEARELLLAVSTNLHHLMTNPVLTLAGSSVTLAEPVDIGELLVFLLILAPTERLAGPRRTGALFVAGHVVGTCASEFGVMLLHHLGILAHAAWNRIDVGPSYGEMAVLAGLCFLLPCGWRRRAGTAVAAAPAVVTCVIFRNMATTGHVIAFLLGAALAPSLFREVRAGLYRSRAAIVSR